MPSPAEMWTEKLVASALANNTLRAQELVLAAPRHYLGGAWDAVLQKCRKNFPWHILRFLADRMNVKSAPRIRRCLHSLLRLKSELGQSDPIVQNYHASTKNTELEQILQILRRKEAFASLEMHSIAENIDWREGFFRYIGGAEHCSPYIAEVLLDYVSEETTSSCDNENNRDPLRLISLLESEDEDRWTMFHWAARQNEAWFITRFDEVVADLRLLDDDPFSTTSQRLDRLVRAAMERRNTSGDSMFSLAARFGRMEFLLALQESAVFGPLLSLPGVVGSLKDKNLLGKSALDEAMAFRGNGAADWVLEFLLGGYVLSGCFQFQDGVVESRAGSLVYNTPHSDVYKVSVDASCQRWDIIFIVIKCRWRRNIFLQGDERRS